MKTIIRRIQWLVMGVCLTLLVSGCVPINVTRTVGLKGLPPLTSADQVKLVEGNEKISQPYQVVGQVTLSRAKNIWKEHPVPLKGSSFQRMKEVAAGMGADGLIGLTYSSVHFTEVGFRSGLAVKWLAPGEAKRPLDLPFLVAVLPVTKDPDAPGNQSKIAKRAYSAVNSMMAMKGYYILPAESVKYKGGIEDVKQLDESELRKHCGEDANFLMEVAITDREKTNFIIASDAGVRVKTKLMDLKTRTMVYQGAGTGAGYVGWLLNMSDPNLKWYGAIDFATGSSLKNVVPIYEKLGD
jgi:uncharacterized protein YbjQ (UPF0145 family)